MNIFLTYEHFLKSRTFFESVRFIMSWTFFQAMKNFGMRTFFRNLQLCRNPELLSKGKIENRKNKKEKRKGLPAPHMGWP